MGEAGRDEKKKFGFTLVELLVVISIIALLMGILLPALGRARKTAYSVVCKSNLRGIALAACVYVSENNNKFPPYRMSTYSLSNPEIYVNKYGRKKPRWPWFFEYGIGPVINPKPYVKNPGDTFGDSDTLIMTNDFFMCPSFNRAGFDGKDIRNGSYGYNYQYLGNRRITDGSYRNYPIKLARIERPGETVLVADSRGIEDEGIHGYTLDPPKLAESVGAVSFARHSNPTFQKQHSPADARHNGEKKVNVSFVDSHVEALTREELGYICDENGNVVANHPDGSNCLWSGTGRDEK
ncbi:MAG: type II secretion system GspH family protein [Anaerohalosphaeraceae bacterium]|nr:type II secretion system GspH family protein [Anaerohalosphaeraceae bacterium]